jgi:alginate O-acetyltransferase complex protein AlgI
VVFSSYLFLFYFLPAALLAYYAAPRRAKHVVLTLASYLFYGWANPLFVFLLLGTTILDYVAALVMTSGAGAGPGGEQRLDPTAPRTRGQRAALAVSICGNLGLLGFFKYFNFCVDNVNALAASLGLSWLGLDTALRVTLPLGISFYTFQSMSYTIDVYRGHTGAIRSFVDFACYVSMFPQLVAGPIVRFSEVADQLRARDHTSAKFARGVAFFSVGLAKKVLLANPCGKIADLAFGAGSLGVVDAWYGVTAYAFQIYFDFSGYSDMAIGLGLMLGFVFPKNFDSPYLSKSITEFWRRWHISLSTWLRDYVFLKLSFVFSRRLDGVRWLGFREDVWIYAAATLATMLLGGLWHGAAWNFVVWGGLHGLLIVLERFRGRRSFYHRLPGPVRVGWTFLLVLVAWVFFRAPNLPSALAYLGQMAGVGAVDPGAGLISGVVYQPYYLGTFVLAALIVWGCPQTWDWTRRLTAPKAATVVALFVLAAVVLTTQAYNPFIYFIF